MRDSSGVKYFHSDHLGSATLTTDSSGNVYHQVRHYLFGEQRWQSGADASDYDFTGQRLEDSFGLLDYNARYYDPAIGRFLSADTVVPDFAESQDLNRYSYVRNVSLNYVDPTGMFSEDEIMSYMGVENWEDVLAQFEDGGQFAGAWGFLEVLRQVELGFEVSIAWNADADKFYETAIHGAFYEADGGELMFQGQFFGKNDFDIPGLRLGSFATSNQATYRVFNDCGVLQGVVDERGVQGVTIYSREQYFHTVFCPDEVDKVSLAWDATSLGLSLFGLGAAAKWAKAATIANKTSSYMSLAGAGESLVVDHDPSSATLGVLGSLSVPIISVPASTAAVIKDLNLYYGP